MNAKRAKALRKFARLAVGPEGKERELQFDHVTSKVALVYGKPIIVKRFVARNVEGTFRSVYRRLKKLTPRHVGRA